MERASRIAETRDRWPYYGVPHTVSTPTVVITTTVSTTPTAQLHSCKNLFAITTEYKNDGALLTTHSTGFDGSGGKNGIRNVKLRLVYEVTSEAFFSSLIITPRGLGFGSFHFFFFFFFFLAG